MLMSDGHDQLGLASNLKLTPQNEVRKSEFYKKLSDIEKEKSTIVWPKDSDALPVVTWEECAYLFELIFSIYGVLIQILCSQRAV
jgi:hypothetical protein